MNSVVKNTVSKSRTAYNKKLISDVLHKAETLESNGETEETKMYDAMINRKYDIEVEHNRAEVANLYIL